MWYLIHLTTYAAIALSWFHQLPDGNEFILNPGAARYWAALYLITLALVILFRLALPVFHAFLYQLRVAEVEREGPGVVSLRITGRHLDRMKAQAGQFFLWRFLTRKLAWESHPFSLSAAPDSQSMRITVKSLGDFSSRIGEMKPGTRVVGEGPFGLFTDEVRRHMRVALIAGGVGITPIRALLEHMSGDIVLIYRVVSDDEIVFRDEIEQMARERDITVHYVTGSHRDPGGERLLSSEHLRQLVPDIGKRDVYICGPPAMSDLVEVNARRAGVPQRNIHTEAFAFSPNTSGWKGIAFLPRGTRLAILGTGAAVVAVIGARFGWTATHSNALPPTATVAPTAVPTAPAAVSTPKPAATSPVAAATATPASATFAGTTVQTQYGPVQVTLTTQGKRITGVTASISPQDQRSQSIEGQAIPILKQETLQAQSASVNTVSGATVVSDAYIQSLQSALSKAGI
jgi:ferredoxin-NADP reductase/uncharacterized protein with FMN-binding domain